MKKIIIVILFIPIMLAAQSKYRVHEKTDDYLAVICNSEIPAEEKALNDAIYDGFIFAQKHLTADMTYVYLYLTIKDKDVIFVFRALAGNVEQIGFFGSRDEFFRTVQFQIIQGRIGEGI